MMKYAALALLATASAASAHPGHEAPVPDGAAHWLTSVDHLAVVGTATALLWLAFGLRVFRTLLKE